jgi:glycosyltransferase involved in cell wall biosynthesis
MTSPALSALIVAHNEEREIEACMASCAFADETVVVLDKCTDRTRVLALRNGARIVEGDWANEGLRRNAGIAACAGPWILELDCDERVTPDLAEEIKGVLPGAMPGIFSIGFNNYVGKRLVRHGWGAYNGVGSKNCLFHKGSKIWGGDLVHPKLIMTGPRTKLAGRIDHYVDNDLDDMFARLNRYTSLAARQAVIDGEIPSRYHTVRRVFGRFYKSYVARKGYKEGVYGVALAIFSALYPLLTCIKARALVQEKTGDAE